jgi:hypothetical protein
VTGGQSESSDNPVRRVPDWRVTLPLAQACTRCGALTRRGTPCRGPAVRNRRRCRMHGGTAPGAPPGPKHGMFKHGLRSAAAIERRRIAAAEGRVVRAMIRELKAEAKRIVELS